MQSCVKMKWLVTGVILLLCCGCIRPWLARRRAVRHYAVALALQDAQFERDAMVQLREAVRFDSDLALAHSMLGDLSRKYGRYDQAAEAYANACRLNPWAFDDHLHLGEVYRILKRFNEAIVALRRACQLQPKNAEANYGLGICYYETEKYDLAAAFCRRAAELAPDNHEIMSSLGDIYGRNGEDYRAIKAYKQALELDPNDYDVMIRLGMVYLHVEWYNPAQFILQKAVAAARRNPEPRIALGYCLLCRDTPAAALEQYQEALELDAESFAALNGIGVAKMLVYLEDRRQQSLCAEAIECWHRSLELNPDQPKIQRLLAKYKRYLQELRASNKVLPEGTTSPSETLPNSADINTSTVGP